MVHVPIPEHSDMPSHVVATLHSLPQATVHDEQQTGAR
jgi:hypothetical protein